MAAFHFSFALTTFVAVTLAAELGRDSIQSRAKARDFVGQGRRAAERPLLRTGRHLLGEEARALEPETRVSDDQMPATDLAARATQEARFGEPGRYRYLSVLSQIDDQERPWVSALKRMIEEPRARADEVDYLSTLVEIDDSERLWLSALKRSTDSAEIAAAKIHAETRARHVADALRAAEQKGMEMRQQIGFVDAALADYELKQEIGMKQTSFLSVAPDDTYRDLLMRQYNAMRRGAGLPEEDTVETYPVRGTVLGQMLQVGCPEGMPEAAFKVLILQVNQTSQENRVLAEQLLGYDYMDIFRRMFDREETFVMAEVSNKVLRWQISEIFNAGRDGAGVPRIARG